MTDNLKQLIEQVKLLSFEENEALRSIMFSINYKRKEAIEQELKQLVNN